MPESKYSIDGIKNGISILFLFPKSGGLAMDYANTDLFSRLYALKKILPINEHYSLKCDLRKIIKHSKLNIAMLNILPADWEIRYDEIKAL